jgi:hypothetical protein
MRFCLALLMTTAAFAQEPEKAPAQPNSTVPNFRLLQRPGTAKPRLFVVAPNQFITVRPQKSDPAMPQPPLCSVPLTNVLPGQANAVSRMPVLKPPTSGTDAREQVRVPAPPCDERKP